MNAGSSAPVARAAFCGHSRGGLATYLPPAADAFPPVHSRTTSTRRYQAACALPAGRLQAALPRGAGSPWTPTYTRSAACLPYRIPSHLPPSFRAIHNGKTLTPVTRYLDRVTACCGLVGQGRGELPSPDPLYAPAFSTSIYSSTPRTDYRRFRGRCVCCVSCRCRTFGGCLLPRISRHCNTETLDSGGL